MIRIFAMVGALALGACVAQPKQEPIPLGAIYRDQTALIGTTSRFDPKKFEGVWYVRQGFHPDAQRLVFRMLFSPNGHVMRLGALVCDGAGVCGDYAEDLPAKELGKGRYSVTMPNGQTREFWVLWVDEGFRTAVLGNKTGDFGWIVDRSTKGGADRIKAAREILDFNGYDVSQLKVVR